MTNRQPIIAKLRTHAYLVRLVASLILLCAFIVSAFLYFSAHSQRIQHSRDQEVIYQHTGKALVDGLDRLAAQLQNAAMQTDTLPEQALPPYLRGAEYSLDIITRLCVYHPDTKTLVGSAGEESLELLAHTLFPSLSTQQFISHLTAHHLSPFAEKSNGMIAFPIKTKEHIVLYILNGNILKAYVDAALPRPFELLTISDAQGSLLLSSDYASPETPSFLASNAGLSISITPPDRTVGSDSVRLNMPVLLLICIAFLIPVIYFLYYPIRTMRRAIPATQREELRELDEFTAIATSIADGERLQEEMQQEALEQRSITISRLFEKLLYGIRIPPEKLSVLPLTSAGQYQVAVARLNQVKNVNAVKSRLMNNKQLYVLELYDTAHLTFILEADVSADILEHIHQELNVPLGVGTVCNHLTGLHRSYIEAVSALGTGEGIIWFTKNASKASPEENPQISALADALLTFMQNDRERAMTVADEIFDLLDTQEDSLLFRQQAYVRFVIPFFDRVRETYPEAQFSIEPITNATHWGSVSLKERFCQALTEAMNSLPVRKPLEHDGLLFFVEEHLFDPYFGLGDIAQKYNITEYTASRLFKEVGGVSFKKYVTNRRIERAKYLLTSSELKMSEIAQQCGFASASYFARIFRNAEDLSPAEYRQQAQMTKPQ